MDYTKWNFKSQESKLLALGIPNNNTSDFDAIVASRWARKDELISRLNISLLDRVLDLGSGMGFLAEAIAPHAAKIYCADISDTFLDDCRRRVSLLDNVEVQKVGYADLSALYGRQINKVYATLLFIHFNFYDIVFYLQELNKVMDIEGLLYFDYNDGERFSFEEKTESFNGHLAIYKENREHWVFGCMHMTSYGILKNLAPQLGFQLLNNWPSSSVFSCMLMEKIRHL
ncbi:MAG: class I SAM-dependent methyltransferase [Rhodomicrobiaceae bacterium]